MALMGLYGIIRFFGALRNHKISGWFYWCLVELRGAPSLGVRGLELALKGINHRFAFIKFHRGL